jgi:ribosomal protein L7/L12
MGLFSNPGTDRRLASIERKLDAIMTALGMAPAAPAPGAGPVDPELLRLVQRGEKIAAIKLHRERTGVGLAEAKAFVDALG